MQKRQIGESKMQFEESKQPMMRNHSNQTRIFINNNEGKEEEYHIKHKEDNNKNFNAYKSIAIIPINNNLISSTKAFKQLPQFLSIQRIKAVEELSQNNNSEKSHDQDSKKQSNPNNNDNNNNDVKCVSLLNNNNPLINPSEINSNEAQMKHNSNSIINNKKAQKTSSSPPNSTFAVKRRKASYAVFQSAQGRDK